jgi:hypothetical protein
MTTLLSLYNSSASSSILTSAELLVSTGGGAKGATQSTNIGTHINWIEIGLGAGNALAGAVSIQAPDGTGAFFDATTLVGQQLDAGNYSATLTLLLDQAGKQIVGDITLRFYKYNSSTHAYTSIGNLTQTGVTITSSDTTVNFSAGSFAAMTFATNESLYVDCWMNLSSNTMISGGHVLAYQSNSTTLGWTGAMFVTPGYDPPTTFITGTDQVNSTEVDLILDIFVPTESLTIGLEQGAVVIGFAPVDTASITDTSTVVSIPIGIVGTDQLTLNDSTSSFVLTSNLSDTTVLGTDRLAQVIPSTFQTDQLTLSDSAASTVTQSFSDAVSSAESALKILTVLATDSLTENSSMTFWSQPLFLFFTDGLLTPSDQGFFYQHRQDMGYALLALDSFSRSNVASDLGTATDTNNWQYLQVTGANPPTSMVSGNQGSIINSGTDTPYVLGNASQNAEVVCRFTPSNSSDVFGILARATFSLGSLTAYKLAFSAGNIRLYKDVANTTTQLTAVAFTVTANTAYYLRLRLVNTALYGKIWAVSTAEPAAWNITTTDSAISGSGQAGILVNTATGSNAVTFDSFFAVDNLLLDALIETDSSSFGATRTLAPDDAPPLSDSIVATVIWPFTDQLATSDTVAGGVPWPIIDIAPGPLLESLSFVNSANQGWTTLGLDTFVRSNVSGSWGTATDGNTWAVATGSTPTLSIQSNQGLATGFTGQTFMRLGSATASDSEVIMRFLVPSTNIVTLGVCLRLSGNTAYRARINTQNSTFGLIRVVSGTSTDLVTTAFTPTIGGYCWMKFRVQGTALYGKVWKDGTAEPVAWILTTTDSNIASGGVGLAINPAASGDIFKFDSFNAFDYALADNALIESEYFFIQKQILNVESTPEVELLATAVALTFETEVVTVVDASTETLIDFASDSLSISDNFQYVTPPQGLSEISQLTIAESSILALAYHPVEISDNAESVLYTEAFSAGIDSLTTTEAQLFTGILAPIEVLSSADSIAQIGSSSIPAELVGALSDGFVWVIASQLSDSVATLDSRIDNLAYSDGDSTPIPPDILNYGVPSNFMDDVTSLPKDTFSSALTQRWAEIIVQSESALFLEAGSYLENTLPTTESYLETLTALLSGSATYSATLYPSAIITDQPVAYYRLNEASGSTAFDSTVNHHDATLNKRAEYSLPGAIIGDADTAISFDPNGGIILHHDLDIASFSALTLEYWISIESVWLHVVTTLDNNTGTITKYLNGNLYIPDTSGETIITELDFFASGTPKSALLDEVAIYNKILTPTQIFYHYQAGSGALISAPLLLRDTVVASIPAQLNDTALSITEIAAFSDGNRYDLAVDQLTITDSLFVKDNFTDIVAVTETVRFTVQSNILEPRSILYSNIIADTPSAYWQLNEDVFAGIYQRNGQDQPNNASSPNLLGATLEYTWAQIEPQEGNRLWDIIDADILPWSNQAKTIIIRVMTASNVARNSVPYFQNTAGQATPQWVFDAGAPSVTGFDGTVYPVYWNAIYQQKYAAFIAALAQRYDTNANVAAVLISCGVNGTTQLEASGGAVANTVALWTPRGYTPQQWVTAMDWTVMTYQNNFLHTSLILSVNSAFIQPNNIFNIDQCISLAVGDGVWLMDENVYVGEAHNNPNWNVVPLISVPRSSAASGGDSVSAQLTLESNYQSDYACVWADDITSGANNTVLSKYALSVVAKKLTDSATGNFVMPTAGGVYPTAHIATGDYLNGAQQFNGLSGYGMFPAAPQTTLSSWTLKASIFPTVLPTQESIIVCNGQGGISSAGGYALGIAGGSSGGPGDNFCVYLPGIGWYDSGYAFPSINQWYALFATWDGTTLKCYVNGVQTPFTYTVTSLAVQPRVTIGGLWDGFTRTATRLFIGSIDEVAIYPTVLSSSRIAQLTNIELGLVESPVGSALTMKVTDALTVDDSSSVFICVQSLIDTALTVSEQLAFSLADNSQNAATILGQDNFNRLDQSGWGTANDGQVWSTVVGSPSLSIVSNQGKFTNTAVGCVMLLGNATGTQEEGIVRLTFSATGAPGVGIVLRATDGSNHYRARVSSANFALVKVVGGTATNIVTSTFTYTINTAYWIRFKAQGSNLYGKIWVDGTAEPVAWTLSTTDATYSNGKIGLFSQLAVSNNNVLFDNFFVVDNPLTDKVTLNEQYSFTQILPPFIETSFLIDASKTEIDPLFSEQLTESESTLLTGNTTGRDFLLFAPSKGAWQETTSLIDPPLTVNETLLTPVSRSIIDTPLIVSDVSTFVAGGGGGGQIEPFDAQGWVVAEYQTDQIINIDASKVTYERIFTDQLSTSDSSNFTGGFLELTQVTVVESIVTTEGFVPADHPVITEQLFSTVEDLATDSTIPNTDIIMPTIRFVPVELVPISENISVYFAVSLIWNNPPPVSDVIIIVEGNGAADNLIPADSLALFTALALPIDVQVPADNYLVTVLYNDQDSVLHVESLALTVFSLWTDQSAASDVFMSNGTFHGTDTLAVFDTLSFTESVSLGTVTGLSDAILSTVRQSWTTQTNTISDSVRTFGTQFYIDQQSSVESLALVFSSSLVDGALTTDSTFAALLQRSIDALTAQELPLTTQIAFFTSDNSISSDFAFSVIYQSFSEALSVGESASTAVNQLQRDSLVSSALFASALLYQPVEALTSTEKFIDAIALTFPGDVNTLTDASSNLLSTSFTGWTDLLYQAEQALFIERFVPTEQTLELESFTVSESETIQELATPVSENAFYTMKESLTEQNFSVEILVPTIRPQDVNALQNFEYVIYQPTQFETEQTPGTDNGAFTVRAVPIDQLLQVERPLFTESVAQNDPGLSLVESRTYTTIMAPVELLSEQERVLLALSISFTESTPVTDNAPSLGYTLAVDTLSISDKLNYVRTTYEVITALVHSGRVTGNVLTGQVTGTILTGQVKGIVP